MNIRKGELYLARVLNTYSLQHIEDNIMNIVGDSDIVLFNKPFYRLDRNMCSVLLGDLDRIRVEVKFDNRRHLLRSLGKGVKGVDKIPNRNYGELMYNSDGCLILNTYE